MRVPSYVSKIIGSNFRDRTVMYYADLEIKTYNTTRGVPQGSVLGPLLRIAMYDAVLRIFMPIDVKAFGFSDDKVLVAVGKYTVEVTLLMNIAVATIRDSHKLGP